MFPRIAIALGLVGAIVLQGPLGRSNADRRRNDFRYTPDTDVTRILSFGHRSTLADTIWIRALPDLSREFDDLEMKERWLSGVFDVVTDLEPSFYTAYAYGSTYLGLIRRQSERSIALLERGVAAFEQMEAEDGRQYSDGTRLRIDLAMAYHPRDLDKVIEHLDIAVARPDCDTLTRAMRVGLALKNGNDLIALTIAARNVEHPNSEIREDATRAYERRKLQIARRCHREFVAREGRPPESVAELRAGSDVNPAAAEVVFPSVVYDDQGVVQVPALEELERRHLIRSLEAAAHHYRRNNGGWPDVEWFFDPKNPFMHIKREEVPEGTHIEIDDEGVITFVAD